MYIYLTSHQKVMWLHGGMASCSSSSFRKIGFVREIPPIVFDVVQPYFHLVLGTLIVY